MKLYHFTSTDHLRAIQRSGLILPTESNVGSPVTHMPPYGAHRGPNVIWMLSTPDVSPNTPGWAHGLTPDKLDIRITVDLPQPLRWLDWEWGARMHPAWREIFIEAGGGMAAVGSWYIWPVPIRKQHWAGITHMRSGRAIEPPSTPRGKPS
jgi:hypothetical protein